MGENLAYGLKPTRLKGRGIPNWAKGSTGSTFKCPSCDSRYSAVIDSRPHPDYHLRKRACPECDTRFTTREYFEGTPLPSKGPFPELLHDSILGEWRRNLAAVIEGTMP